MTKKELVNKLNEEFDDNDIIDYLHILSKDHNALDVSKTTKGYFIQSYYKPINYKHLNDPSRND